MQKKEELISNQQKQIEQLQKETSELKIEHPNTALKKVAIAASIGLVPLAINTFGSALLNKGAEVLASAAEEPMKKFFEATVNSYFAKN
ncbi:MAG: hypothetical protein UR26_C0002G0228 [candidate division TM6 bacterium GW2011_GWF2_32_72]|nr:MAG: hypothetical protein UR26_C0002G0228 [candidate division TM6 bacterium GW2011_GWF2_32_72]